MQQRCLRRVLKEGPWYEGGDANSMRMKMSTCIRKVASEEFRVIKGGKRETKDEDIKNRWREYFDKLFNEDSESSCIELDIS
jgi:hypothetical protein